MDDDIIYTTLSDEDYAKAIGQFRLAVGATLQVFNMYGMGEFIAGVQDEIVRLAEDFGLRVRGIDKPISIDYVRRAK